MIVRRQRGPTWAEGCFWLISAGVHAVALSIASTGRYPVHVPKWFDLTFGIPSPTSGTTRAIIALDSGRIGDALLFNPVATLAGVFSWLFLIYLPVSLLRGRALALSEPLRRALTWTALGLLFVCWLIKLALVSPRFW